MRRLVSCGGARGGLHGTADVTGGLPPARRDTGVDDRRAGVGSRVSVGCVPDVPLVPRPTPRCRAWPPCCRRGRGRTSPVRGGRGLRPAHAVDRPGGRRRRRARGSARSTCTASAARRPTGPTWPPCWPSASTAGRSTCPGFGRSQPPPRGRYSIRGHVRAVVDVLEHVARPARATGQGRPVHLLGNSLGGLVSVLVAARRPDLVASLTLDLTRPCRSTGCRRRSAARCCSCSLPGVPALAERRMAGITPEQQRAGDDPDVLRRPVAGAAGADRAGRPGDARAGRAAVGRPRAHPQHARADHLLPAGRRGQRLAAGRRRCRCRRSCSGATGTGWSTRRWRPRLAAAVPDARLLVLEGVGHVAMLEAPEETARAVLGLVEERPATRAE